MIVRQFLSWVRTAPAGERADATRALARAYLVSDFSGDDRTAAEGALLMLLDDASPLVRLAMAEVFAHSADAPPVVIHALATDQPIIAAPILEHSPLVIDADLVDIAATGNVEMQCAIARRAELSAPIAAAIAEVGVAQACLELLENPSAEFAGFSLDRIAERFGHLAAIRELLIARHDLPAPTRLMLTAKVSDELMQLAAERDWLDPERTARLVAEGRERACIIVAAQARGPDLQALVSHLRDSGQLTAGLILRALLCGNTSLFECSLADLSGLPVSRVSALLADRGGSGLTALMTRAGLPSSTFAGFREALAAMEEVGFVDSVGGITRLRRRMVERVLMRCAEIRDHDVEPLLALLRRFATESAREEARLFCDELLAEEELIEEVAFVSDDEVSELEEEAIELREDEIVPDYSRDRIAA